MSDKELKDQKAETVPEPDKEAKAAKKGAKAPKKDAEAGKAEAEKKPVGEAEAKDATANVARVSVTGAIKVVSEEQTKAHAPVPTPPGSGAGTTSSTGTAKPTGQEPKPVTSNPALKSIKVRKVRLVLSKVDPWSVMKLAFLLSIALGIILVVASVMLWTILDSLHVFTGIEDAIAEIAGDDNNVNIMQYFEFGKMLAGSTVIGIINVILITALSTIGAFLYNVTSALVGGLHLTMTDE